MFPGENTNVVHVIRLDITVCHAQQNLWLMANQLTN